MYRFYPRINTVARKRPRCRSAGYTQPKTNTPLNKRSRSWLAVCTSYSAGTHQGNELTRNSPGNSRPQSSQLTEPLWTNPCCKGAKLPRSQELSTLLQNTQAGNYLGFLIALRRVERGSARRSSLKGRERDIVSQTNIGTVSKALGKLLRDGMERIWAFPST